jgi:cell division septation protein DedD
MKPMRVRITLAHVVALIVLCALAFAGLTLAFSRGGSSASKQDVKIPPPPTKTVPDVVGQPYVFAESSLQQRGFGWRVTGPVAGWAGATVVSQNPAGGTTVVDTGAPAVTLRLKKPKGYVTRGTPENSSPFTATKIMLPASSTVTGITATSTSAQTTVPAQTTTPPAQTTAGTKIAKPAKPKTVKPKTAKTKSTQAKKRPPAFVVPGAKREPLDEIPLPERARNLNKWLDSHRQASDASVRYWLYQHAWIVTGAKFGWWHGAQALQILISVDRRVEQLWGIGSRSEAEARAALEFVKAHSR